MADWDKITARGNVEDRRSFRPAAIGGGLGITGILLVMGISMLLGGSPLDTLNQLQNISVDQQQQVDQSPDQYSGQDKYEVFASEVLGSNNDMWQKTFNQMGQTYVEPKLVLFRQATESGCGVATSDVGPHYCPNDQTVYLDETFFDEIATRLGAQNTDVEQAYVIAHEVGHHAQNLLGLLNEDTNQDSIKVELQADCFAGLWANSIKDQGILGPGEIKEAMDAAAAVGDDRVQKAINGRINPETWTHGSSAQRLSSFTKGYDSGQLQACETK